MKFVLSIAQMTFKTLSKTNENAAHLTENLLTITEKLMMEGTVGLLLNDAEVARDLKKIMYYLKIGKRNSKSHEKFK
jgi:phospholipid/cholesterol/gamma-HCH transport system substrate-binding protein